MSKRSVGEQREVRAGDIFAVPLPDGRYGAVRVIRTSVTEDERTALVALTPWLEQRVPSPDEPLLREILRQHRGRFGGAPALCWYAGSLPTNFVHVGIMEPSAADLGLDPQGAYCGEWDLAMINPVLWERGEQPPRAGIRGRSGPKLDRVAGVMTESKFWEVIDRLDRNEGGTDVGVASMIDYLATLSAKEIAGFQRQLAERLSALDREEFARELGEFSYGGSSFSPDHFLDVRAAVVASGRKFYEQVLANPRQMPKEREFERLLTVAEEAYRKKTGRTPEFVGIKDYETFSNRDGWRA